MATPKILILSSSKDEDHRRRFCSPSFDELRMRTVLVARRYRFRHACALRRMKYEAPSCSTLNAAEV